MFLQEHQIFVKFCYETEKETANETYDFLKAAFGDLI